MTEALPRRDLTPAGTNLSGDLRLHQLTRNADDRLPDEVIKTPITDLRNDINNRHALLYDHRGVLLLV
jgi:hypothetical protein